MKNKKNTLKSWFVKIIVILIVFGLIMTAFLVMFR
jgi:hypothetical protein